MKAATVHEIKQELQSLKPAQVVELCLRLSRFKKENKELLTYLLFEAHDEQSYIESVKQEMNEHFGTINLSHLYFAKKTLRKILRLINKYIRYSGSKKVEAELLIYYCREFKETRIPFEKNQALANLYNNQLKKANAVVKTLHEDLQYEYLRELKDFA